MIRLLTMGALALTSLLAACGGHGGGSGGGAGAGGVSGVQAPAAVVGTWGADCSQPFVKFDGGKITVFPDKATYDLKSASLANGQLTVAYATAAGPVTEVYVQDGQTLRLDHGAYGGSDATWEKAPMNKCA